MTLQNSGVDPLKCQNCPKVYTGQAECNFCTRYKEHVQDICNNREEKEYTCHMFHLNNDNHNTGISMDCLEINKKGCHLNTLEKYIYSRTPLIHPCWDRISIIFLYIHKNNTISQSLFTGLKWMNTCTFTIYLPFSEE
jgi:hypothetical protein